MIAVFILRFLKSVSYLALTVFFLTTPGVAKNLILKVGIYQNPPKIYVNEKGQAAGFFPEILEHIAKKEGWQLQYIPCAWAQCLDRLESGSLDLMPDVAWSDERKKRFDFTHQPVLANWSRIYTHSPHRIRSILDLDKKKVAVVEGSIQARIFSIDAQAYNILPRLVKVQSFAAVFDLISKMQVDAGIVNRLFGAQQKDNFGIKETGIILYPSRLMIASPKGKNESLLIRIDNQLIELKRDKSSPYYQALEKVLLPGKKIFAPSLSLTAEEQAWLAKHPEITIAVNNAWPPMDYLDSQGNVQGIGVDFITMLNSRLGDTLKMVPGSWQQNFDAVRERRLDCLMDITPRPGRQPLFHFTKPYLNIPHVIFSRKEGPYFSNLSQLSGKTVGFEKGFFIARVLREKYPNILAKEYPTTSDALDAVSKGEIDAYIGNRAVARYIIEQELITNLEEHGKIEETASINAIGVRKDQPILRDILQKALNDLTREEKSSILKKWITPPNEAIQAAYQFSDGEKQWLENHPEIRIGAMNNWVPFDFLNGEKKPSGIGADLVKIINHRLDNKLKIVPGSWKEMLVDLKEKRLDALLDLSPMPGRMELYNFTEPYLSVPHVIVSRKDSPYRASEDDLAGKVLALERGFGNVHYFQTNFPDVHIREYDNTAKALGAVSRGEADAYAGNRAVAIYFIEKEMMMNLTVHGRLSRAASVLAIGIRKDWPILQSILQKTLASIPEHKKQEIFRRWVSMEQSDDLIKLDLTAKEKEFLNKHPVIHAGINCNRAPIAYLDKKKNFQGISANYLNRLEEMLGVQFKIAKNLSRQQSFEAFKQGKLDLFTSLRTTPDGEKLFDFTDPYTSFPIAIFAGPQVPYIGSMKELSGHRVGVVGGSAIHELLNTHHDIQLVPVDTAKKGLEMLSGRKIEVYVGNLLVTGFYIGQLGYSHIKVVGEIPYNDEQSIGVRKDWPILVSILNKALAAIPATERININKRWVGVRYEHEFDSSLLWKVFLPICLLFALFFYWNRRLYLLNQQLVAARNQEHIARKEAQHAKTAAEQANVRLQELDKLKSMFIASMSHELRTPLNSIIGFSGMFLQGILGSINSEQKDSLERIHRSGNHLLSLISDIIDISKIEAGRIDFYPTHFPLQELVDEAIETVRPQAEAKGLELIVEADSMPEMFSERKRLLQCLLNYLSNAVKFTENGTVTLSISCQGDCVILKVIDTGIGIAREDIPKLFEAFERLESHLKIKAGGTGLGLYLTKKITEELLHGTTFVTSEPEKGSIFGLQIPIHVSQEEEECRTVKNKPF